MPFSLASAAHQKWLFGRIWCLVQGYTSTSLHAISIFSLTTISVDRYYAIVSPLRYPYLFTNIRAVAMIISIWGVSFLIGIPPLFKWGEYGYQNPKLSCGIRVHVITGITRPQYVYTYLVFCFLIPVTIMVWCYGKIFIAAVGHRKRSNRICPAPSSQSQRISDVRVSFEEIPIHRRDSTVVKDKDYKAARTILLILLAFILCWLPHFYVLFKESGGCSVSPKMQTTGTYLVYFSTVANPCIYGYLNRSLRFEMKRLIKNIITPQQESTGIDIDIVSTTFTNLSNFRASIFGGRPSSSGIQPRPHGLRNCLSLTVALEMQTIAELSEDLLENETVQTTDEERGLSNPTPRSLSTHFSATLRDENTGEGARMKVRPEYKAQQELVLNPSNLPALRQALYSKSDSDLLKKGMEYDEVCTESKS